MTLRPAPVDEFAIKQRFRFLPSRFEVLAGAGHIAGTAIELAERGIKRVIV